MQSDLSDICLLGLNHKVAPVEVREQVAFAEEEVARLLPELLKETGIEEAFLLSTCNRTELYAVGESVVQVEMGLRHFLEQTRGDFYRRFGEKLYVMTGEEAVVHLFRVAAGMDSMILGEPQILGQVKAAYQLAMKAGVTGALLNRMLDFALIAGKRVRHETALGWGAVSIPYAAVELAGKIFGHFERRTALLIGAGEMGVLTARHLKERHIGRLLVTNRTPEKAQQVARELDGEAVPFDRFLDLLPELDMVIGTTGAPHFILNASQFQPVLSRRGQRPIYLLDIAVPRDFDPDLARFENVFLHDIDDLGQIVQRNLEKRRRELPRAETIVQEEAAEFMAWRRSLQVTPTIVALRQQLESIRQQELARIRHKVSPQEFATIDRVTRSFLNKVLHQPISHLRRLSNGSHENLAHIAMVRKIFNLEEDRDQTN